VHGDIALPHRRELAASITGAQHRLQFGGQFPNYCLTADKFTVLSKSQSAHCHIVYY
jgi:hypothetical protein